MLKTWPQNVLNIQEDKHEVVDRLSKQTTEESFRVRYNVRSRKKMLKDEKRKKIFCQDHFKSFKKFSSKGIPESISPLWICNACRYLSKLFRMSRSFVSSFKIWCNEKGTMSKDNKTNFLLTPTYSSDMMANSQDEKKKLSNGEKTQLPVSNERKTTKNTGP